MSEATDGVNTEQVEQQPEYTAIEQKAMELGWRPKAEFEGGEEDFIEAKEFVRRQPLFEKISQQSREIKEVRKALEALKTHYTTVKETEYTRALNQLKEARKTAISEGDGERFDALDQEIKTVEGQVEAIKEAKEQPLVQDTQVHPEFQAWLNQNKWFTETKYMRDWAEEYGQHLHARGASPSEVLKQVSQAVKKEFPHKFTNPNKQTAPNVESGGKSSGSSTKKFSEGDLSEQEVKIMNTLVRQGVMTKEKYLADLLAVKKS
jgi:hypothetical protein